MYIPPESSATVPPPAMQLALLSLLSALCSLRCAEGFELLGSSPLSRAQLPAPISRASPVMAGKGFGKSPPPPPKPKKKSAASVKRDAAGSAFDALKASGSPEYMVCIRTVDTSGKQSQWMPVGGIAVPRSNSEDTALSMAIFNNEDVRQKVVVCCYCHDTSCNISLPWATGFAERSIQGVP